MRTYEDLLAVETTDSARAAFILQAISEHKSSDLYQEATIAYDYFRRRNKTIMEYQKLLYTLSGEAVPDNFSANYKFCNAFLTIFIKQEVSHLLGNGVTFQNEKTKDVLGGSRLDNDLMQAAKAALWGAVSFGFYNLDHIDIFKVTEFVPLIGEEDGALHAGVRFWQIDPTKPLRATLYEEDGYTDYIWEKDNTAYVLHPKRPYIKVTQTSIADGEQIMEWKNYPGFPIVPLWGNSEHQSELIGLREKIDGYDLIQSGFANDLDEASQIFWIIQNGSGMDDIDLRKFIERLKVVKAAVVEDGGAKAEAHTIEVPYQARMAALADIKDSLYRDAMALDTDKLSAGNITATAINAAYENLTLKCDDFEACVTEFIKGILALAGIDDEVSYKRSRIANIQEDTQVVLSAAQYLDTETVLNHLPFLSPDEIEGILKRTQQEEAERYRQEQESEEEEPEEEESEEVNGRQSEE